MRVPIVCLGVLGWGNRKGGFEAYGPGGRWNGNPATLGTNPDWGDLLGDALDRAGAHEGAPLIVVALDRSTSKEERDRLMEAIQRTVDDLTRVDDEAAS